MHLSELCTFMNKSASLASLCQDFVSTCKLIPKSKPPFQNFLSENFVFRKFLKRATISRFMFSHSPGVLKNDTRLVQNGTKHYLGTLGRSQCVTSGSYRPFSAVFQPKSTILDFSQIYQMSSIPIRWKIVKKSNAVRVPLLFPGPVSRQQATVELVSAQNVPNHPEYGSSQNASNMPISMQTN